MNSKSRSIHERLGDFDHPNSVDTPIAMSRFIQLSKEYISHTRVVPKEGPDTVQERAACKTFLRIVGRPHVWPVMQCLVKEFQYPIKVEDDGMVFGLILRYLKNEKTPPQILPTPEEYDLWEQETYWTRVTAGLDYLTFAWEHRYSEPGSTGKRRADERSAEVNAKVNRFINIVTEAMADADLDRLENESDNEGSVTGKTIGEEPGESDEE